MNLPQILNMRDSGWLGPGVVRVDRATKWGNPFKLRKGASLAERRQVIQDHRVWLFEARPDLVEVAKQELRGKDLACWCAPLPCHAETLREIANSKGEET